MFLGGTSHFDIFCACMGRYYGSVYLNRRRVTMKEKEGIRIILNAYDINILNQAIQEIIGTVKRTGATVIGPVPIPTKTKKFTVISSPFIYKRSMEQYEIRSIKRLMVIVPTPQTVEALMKLNLSAGVNIKISLDGGKK
jgi:small subunit ribosomal protein S10